MTHKTAAEHAVARIYKALDVDQLVGNHFTDSSNGRSLCLGALPSALVTINAQNIRQLAILSWRWDVDHKTNSSRNVYVACQEAVRQGVRFLLMDKVTVNQEQSDQDMLVERLAFALLYKDLPVIAAYDNATSMLKMLTAEVNGTEVTLGHPFARIVRRPWISQEIDLYRSNPTTVTYVGHIHNLGCDEENGFASMVPRMWESTLTQTILYTLAAVVGMHHDEDFRYILPEYFDLLSAAHSQMSSNDYLLTAALLAGHAHDRRVNNDQSILGIQFEQYQIGPDIRRVTYQILRTTKPGMTFGCGTARLQNGKPATSSTHSKACAYGVRCARRRESDVIGKGI